MILSSELSSAVAGFKLGLKHPELLPIIIYGPELDISAHRTEIKRMMNQGSGRIAHQSLGISLSH